MDLCIWTDHDDHDHADNHNDHDHDDNHNYHYHDDDQDDNHRNAGWSVKAGDDPVGWVNVGFVDVMLATMPRVDRVKAWESCSLPHHCDN